MSGNRSRRGTSAVEAHLLCELPHGASASPAVAYAWRHPASRANPYPTGLCLAVKSSRTLHHVQLHGSVVLPGPFQAWSIGIGFAARERRTITWGPFMSTESVLIRADAPRVAVQTKGISPTYFRRDERTTRVIYKALAIRRSFGRNAARVFLISMGVSGSLVHRIVSSPVERLRR